jgi:cell volume regulation protein A
MILLAGGLGLLAIFAALFANRIGTPLLLAFIAIGMLAGEDGWGGIAFDDFETGYLIGSLSLAVILFEGGLHLPPQGLRKAAGPALALATLGVVISAGLVGAAARFLFAVPWLPALLLGAVVAPTDAAAVTVVLRNSRIALPERVVTVLELESGLNDPMSVFLTIALVTMMSGGAGIGWQHGALLFLREMGGGAVLGLLGGYGLYSLLRLAPAQTSLTPVLALSGALLLFGGAQKLGASGFMAVYLAGAVLASNRHQATLAIQQFFSALGWLAQIGLFLMLGLLVTPRDLPPVIAHALVITLVLILVARPAAVAACLLPCGWKPREAAFIAWSGLRGGVPIFLTIIPVLDNHVGGERLFNSVFVTVIASVAIQGWLIRPVARALKIGQR